MYYLMDFEKLLITIVNNNLLRALQKVAKTEDARFSIKMRELD